MQERTTSIGSEFIAYILREHLESKTITTDNVAITSNYPPDYLVMPYGAYPSYRDELCHNGRLRVESYGIRLFLSKQIILYADPQFEKKLLALIESLRHNPFR